MNRKTEIIKEKLYSYLEEKGFQYEYDRTDGEIWIFKKQDRDLEKSIIIDNVTDLGINLCFSVYGYGQVEWRKLEDESKFNKFKRRDYKNEKEFEALIEEIRKIIVQRADEILGSMGGTYEEREATRSLKRRLYDEHKQLAEKGKTLLGLENVIGMRRIYIIFEHIQKLQGREWQEILDDVFMLSAVYGEIYREITNGHWEYSEEGAGQCVVVAPKCVNLMPLYAIKWTWVHNDVQMLINNIKYAEICQKY